MQKDNEDGSKRNDKDKKSKKVVRIWKKLGVEEDKRKTTENNSSRQHQRRRSSSEQPLRYHISFRREGYQPSHSVRNLLPKSVSKESQDRKKKKKAPAHVAYGENEPTTSDRDHHAAVDFYNRSTPYGYTRESLVDLRTPYKQESHYNLAHRHNRPALFQRQLHSHTKRCKECLEVEIDCICANLLKPRKSDWAVLVQPEPETPKTWTRMRVDWLEDLENDSPIEEKKIVAARLSDDICCFPFSTSQIFSKRDVDHTDYYKKI